MPTVTDHPVTSPRGSDGKFAKSPTFAASGPQDVIKWDDKAGPSFERADEMQMAPAPGSDEDVTPPATPSSKAKAAPKPAKAAEAPAEGEEAQGEAEEAPEEEAPRVDRKAQIKAAIEAAKSKLSLETATKAERERAEKAEAELDRLRKAPLNELFKFRGVTKQEVEDRLLIGADDVDTGDAKPGAAADLTPREKALMERVEKLEGRVEQVQAKEGNEQIRAAVESIKADLAAADVRAIRVTRDGYSRVLMTAHEAWLASGKAGSAKDYIADAAGIVEDEIRAEMAESNPDLLALIEKAPATNGAETEEEAPPPAKKPAPRVAVGRRVVASTTGKPAPLPMDRDARDKAIKDQMFPGWRG